MTGQDILNAMEIFNAELQLQAGEQDVTRGLLAANIAQDYFESLAAQRGKLMGDQDGTVATAAQTEKTAFPAGVLRIDRLVVLDPNNSNLPKREIRPIRRTGGQSITHWWPLNMTFNAQGEPQGYYTNGTNIYWTPLPDAIYTLRWYGFKAADDITAGGTFAYPDIVRLPLATFACQVMKSGVDDDPTTLSQVASQVFDSVLNTLSMFDRDGAVPLEYTEKHLA